MFVAIVEVKAKSMRPRSKPNPIFGPQNQFGLGALTSLCSRAYFECGIKPIFAAQTEK